MTLIDEIAVEKSRHDAVMQGLLWRALVECNWGLINASEMLGMAPLALREVLRLERYPALSRAWLADGRAGGAMTTHKLHPGHYIHDLVDGELDGPFSLEQANIKARILVDRDMSAPNELEIIHIADVTVLPETLPRGGG